MVNPAGSMTCISLYCMAGYELASGSQELESLLSMRTDNIMLEDRFV